MSHIAWWEGGGSALLGALAGAIAANVLPGYLIWRKRKIERKGELIAMQEELRMARSGMETIRGTKQVQALEVRVPLAIFEQGYPKLLGEGSLRDVEMRGLVEYITRAEALNRALDRAGEAATAGQTAELLYQFGRAKNHAALLLDRTLPDIQEQTVLAAVEGTIQRLIREPINPLKKTGRLALDRFTPKWLRL